MEFLKNKFYVSILAAILLIAVAWLYWPRAAINKQELITWISEGYTQQFCKVIYPKIATCVTLSPNACNVMAKEQIDECIAMNDYELPNSTNSENAKKIYDSLAKCFETKTHQKILQVYLVNTPECQQRMK